MTGRSTALVAVLLAVCTGKTTLPAPSFDRSGQREPGIIDEALSKHTLTLEEQNILVPIWLEWRLAEAGLRNFTRAEAGTWEDEDELQIAPGSSLLIGPRSFGPTQQVALAGLEHTALSIDGTAIALGNYPALAGGKRYLGEEQRSIAGVGEGYVAFVGVAARNLSPGIHSVVLRERFATGSGSRTLTRRIRLVVAAYRNQAYLKRRETPSPLPRANGKFRAPENSLLITHARLFDGVADVARANQTLVVESTRIRAIHPDGEVEAPKTARILDATGATVLSGLIDAHLHTPARDDPHEDWLAQGVTTLVDVSGDTFTALTLRDRWLRSGEPRPRLLVSGSMLLPPEGAIVRSYGSQSAYEVASSGQARAAASALARRGVNLIKIALSPDPRGRSLSDEQICEAVAAAHHKGIPVMVHVMKEKDALRAAQCGADILTHMPRLSDDAIAGLRSTGVGVVPTLSIYGFWDYGNATSSVRRLFEAGVAIGTGDDYPTGRPPGLPLKELRGLLESGLEPVEVLRAATRVNAELLGIDASLGTLEPGKIADLIVVDGDPLTDLTTLRNVRAVVASGELVP